MPSTASLFRIFFFVRLCSRRGKNDEETKISTRSPAHIHARSADSRLHPWLLSNTATSNGYDLTRMTSIQVGVSLVSFGRRSANRSADWSSRLPSLFSASVAFLWQHWAQFSFRSATFYLSLSSNDSSSVYIIGFSNKTGSLNRGYLNEKCAVASAPARTRSIWNHRIKMI